MAHLHFTQQLARFLNVPTVEVAAPRLRAALDSVFAQQPRLRGYVLDEQGALRPNVVIFVDGARCRELDDVLRPDSQVYILQALSGG
ncbi:MoaD/ThiS family protein [Janthinobacterium sp.]|uniref:MoaD/ThiS family protein n=1 Tax=Janthinobacterium sp. TaxID=1871054 RepID=UPI002DBBAABC|nr:MoaD/ThiS family protein [Janthinobacterium sp.]HEU4818163.1 MoaD/ThiS family protein [Janthinobacterium sp.]